MKTVYETYQNETMYPDLDIHQACRRLSQAIQCRTTSYVDVSKVDDAQFKRLHDVIRTSFPQVMHQGEVSMHGNSMLIKLTGSDQTLKPILLMSHLDVVPVVKGTEKDWTYGPYSGAIADGMIWGRGALDIKNMVFAILEAAEYCLTHAMNLKRTIYCAFGEDEETCNTGSARMAAYLKKQGVQLEFVLDEGGGEIIDGYVYGAKGSLVSSICLSEKGYADLLLEAKSVGCHSSNPVHGTSLGHLAKAITAIAEHPLPARLSELNKAALRTLAPKINQEPMKTYVSSIEAHENAILDYYLNSEELYNQVSTTIAPTMICEGAQAGNVMPQNMWAVINFRLACHDSIDTLLKACLKLVGDEIKCSYIQANDASAISRYDSYGYQKLTETLQTFFGGVSFIPNLVTGSTDARNYECICDTVLRYGPFIEEGEIVSKGVHGTNERISIRAYAQGIRSLIHLIQQTCK